MYFDKQLCVLDSITFPTRKTLSKKKAALIVRNPSLKQPGRIQYGIRKIRAILLKNFFQSWLGTSLPTTCTDYVLIM